jgi:hypothetical protein
VQVTCQQCAVQTEREGLDALAGGFGFVCPTCGHANVLAPVQPASLVLPEPAPVVPPPQTPGVEAAADGQITCPKCQHQQTDPEACHRCGLVFAYVAEGRARFETDLLANVTDADALRAQWAQLSTQLDDEAGHQAFIERCALEGALEYAGDCYRRLEADPRAEPYRKTVVRMALARVPLDARSIVERDSRTRKLLVLTIAALIMLGFAYGYYLLTRHQVNFQGHG